jgi:hypothetical protein
MAMLEKLGDEGAGNGGSMGGEGSSGSLNPQIQSISPATGGGLDPQPSNAGQFAAEVEENLLSFAAVYHLDFKENHGKNALDKMIEIQRILAISTAERISNSLAVATAAVSVSSCCFL